MAKAITVLVKATTNGCSSQVNLAQRVYMFEGRREQCKKLVSQWESTHLKAVENNVRSLSANGRVHI